MGDRLGTPGAVGFLVLHESWLRSFAGLHLLDTWCVTSVTRDRKSTGVQKNFSLFSKCALPPNQIRNPKTEHRVEIYLNISDYM